MRKVVAFFQTEEDAFRAGEALTTEDLADYSLTKLSVDYEQQIRQEVFLRPKELNNTLIGAFLGSIILGTLFYWLSSQGDLGLLLARGLAGGLPTITFMGVGVGLALGALLAGVYSLSLPLDNNYSGYWMVSLYTVGPNSEKRAVEIIKSHYGQLV